MVAGWGAGQGHDDQTRGGMAGETQRTDTLVADGEVGGMNILRSPLFAHSCFHGPFDLGPRETDRERGISGAWQGLAELGSSGQGKLREESHCHSRHSQGASGRWRYGSCSPLFCSSHLWMEEAAGRLLSWNLLQTQY